MSNRHLYVVGHLGEGSTRETRLAPRHVVVTRSIDRGAVAVAVARHCDPGTEASPTFDGRVLEDHSEYLVVPVYDGHFSPRCAALAIELRESTGCDVADIDHGRDPIDPRAAWGERLGLPSSV